MWLICFAASQATELEELDRALAQAVDEAKLPGASIAVVENGEIVLARGYGFADLATGRRVTPQTLFKAGSVSKNVTSLLALMLSEDDTISLNAP